MLLIVIFPSETLVTHSLGSNLVTSVKDMSNCVIMALYALWLCLGRCLLCLQEQPSALLQNPSTLCAVWVRSSSKFDVEEKRQLSSPLFLESTRCIFDGWQCQLFWLKGLFALHARKSLTLEKYIFFTIKKWKLFKSWASDIQERSTVFVQNNYLSLIVFL